MAETTTQERRLGRHAESPTEVGPRGWKDVAKRVVAEAKDDHLTLMSAGVAFYFLIALIPAIAAVVSIYGLVADPDEVAEQMSSFLSAAPTAVQDLVTEQAERVAATSDAAASLSAAISILLALWAASGGCQHLIEAINAAYDETEKRSFVKRRGLAIVLTVGAVVFLTVTVGAIAVVPALLDSTSLGDAARTAVNIARWPLLLLVVMGALAVLYRVAPNREDARWRWISPGAVIATVLWLVASAGFSVYVSNFGSYNETYGSLGAVIIVMLWLFITALTMILGAEINAEAERQTERDTTTGPSRPMGRREAYAADTVAGGTGEVRGAGEVRGTRSDVPSSSARTGHALHGSPSGSQGGWGSVAVSLAGRAVASVSRRSS